MRNILYVFTFFLFQSNSFSQSPTIQWQKCLGGTLNDTANSVEITSDGGYIIAGSTNSNNGDVSGNHGNSDGYVIKLNSAGTIEWQKCFGTFYNEYIFNAIPTIEGGFIFSGYRVTSGGDRDAWVVKLDSLGEIEWENFLGGSSIDEATHIQQTAEGGFIMCGFTASIDGDVVGQHGYYDFWVVKMSTNGIIEWQKCYGGTNLDRADDIIQTNDGGYIVAGQTISTNGDVNGNNGGYDAWLVKISSIGNTEWQKCLGSLYTDYASSIKQTTDNGYIVGVSSICNSCGSNFLAIKLNSLGVLQWQNSIGGTDTENLSSITQTTDGDYIAVGYTNSNNGNVIGHHGNGDGWVTRLNSSGLLLWQKCIGGSLLDASNSIKQTSDGGFIISGYTNSTDGDVLGYHGNGDAWIVKLNLEPLSINNYINNKITFFPNPSKFNLTFEVPINHIIEEIVINDINGKTVLNKKQNTNQINVENLSNGVYFIKVFTNNEIYISRFIKE